MSVRDPRILFFMGWYYYIVTIPVFHTPRCTHACHATAYRYTLINTALLRFGADVAVAAGEHDENRWRRAESGRQKENSSAPRTFLTHFPMVAHACTYSFWIMYSAARKKKKKHARRTLLHLPASFYYKFYLSSFSKAVFVVNNNIF